MFGNRLGWGISAVIVLVAALLGYQLDKLGRPTPPTGELVAAADHPLPLADLARPLLPAVKPLGDAGPLYRAAVDDYHDHAAAYDELATTRDYDRGALGQLKGFDALVAAAELPTMDLYRSHPDQIVNYDQRVASLDELMAVGKAAANAAALAAYEKKPDDDAVARRYYQAALALGVHLYQERVTYGELAAGAELMSVGVAGLKELAARAHDEPMRRSAAAFDEAKLVEYEKDKGVWRILSGLDDANIARHAGDYFQLADDAKVDPVWRTEAVRRLGRLKFFAFKRADNLRAAKYVKAMADDASVSPALREAAKRSRDITPGENQSAR